MPEKKDKRQWFVKRSLLKRRTRSRYPLLRFRKTLYQYALKISGKPDVATQITDRAVKIATLFRKKEKTPRKEKTHLFGAARDIFEAYFKRLSTMKKKGKKND